MVLCALIFMFRQPSFPSRMTTTTENQDLPMPMLEKLDAEPPMDMLEHNRNFISSKVLLSRILEKRNLTHSQPMSLNTRNFYSHLDLMTVKWAASLNRRRKISIDQIPFRKIFSVCFFLQKTNVSFSSSFSPPRFSF